MTTSQHMNMLRLLVAIAIVAVTTLLAAAPSSSASSSAPLLGGDLFLPYPTSTWACLKAHGWNLTIVRAFHSYGAVDPNGAINLNNAAVAGIARRDIYMYPCFGMPPAQQVRETVFAMGAQFFDTLWFDIELDAPRPTNCAWSADQTKNCAFLAGMMAAARELSVRHGVYTMEGVEKNVWARVMGSNCTVAADAGLPLWNARYDNETNFDGFKPFGGWRTPPAVKQYSNVTSYCGVQFTNRDWMPVS